MFKNEEEFRGWLITQVERAVKERKLPLVVLESKNVSDVIFCIENIHNPIALFLELKYYTANKNRVNIGNSTGGGFQPEILQKKPLYFSKYLKWVLAHEDGYAFCLETNEVCNYISGGAIKIGHQNNIQKGIFNRDDLIDIGDLPEVLIEWVATFTTK